MSGPVILALSLWVALLPAKGDPETRLAILNDVFSKGTSYRVVVEQEPEYGRGTLKLYREDDHKPILIFDPDHNHFIRAFPFDVTDDGEPELISFWTHGVYEQVVIHTLENTPKLLLLETYRFGVIFDLDPLELTSSIRIISSDGPDTRTVRVFSWSKSKKRFELSKTFSVTKESP